MIRKIILSFIFSFLVFIYSFAQAWYPVGAPIRSDYGILAEAVYNGELYAGGWFYSFGSVQTNNMARWNGTAWDSVGGGLTGGQNYVGALCVFNGKLYAAGAFFAAEGLPANNIAVWDGSHWDTVSTQGLENCGNGTGWADAMAVYNGKLYVAGAFCHAGGIPALNIACWNGTKWDSVSSGINDSVNTLAVYNGKLYAGGQFTSAGKTAVSNIACWDGTSWTAVGSGTNNPVFALQAYSGNLYVGGEFTVAGGVSASYIADWNGTTWSAVGAGISGGVGVDAFYVFNGMLYTGGTFSKSGSLKVNNIAAWNGTVWDTVSAEGINNTVDAFAVLDSALYAGGIFTVAGKANAVDIAVWGGTSLGVKEIQNSVGDVSLYPNPNKGLFTVICHSSPPVGGEESLPIIEIYTMLGEKVLTETLHAVQGYNLINFANNPAGIYLYRVTNVAGVIVGQGKLVVE